MPLSKEQFEQLPEFAQSDYVEKDGSYVPSAEVELEQTNGKVSSLKSSLDNLDAKLKDYEKNEAEKIAQAREEALEEARSKGDVKAVEERYQQQMKDLEKRVEQQTRDTVTKEFTEKQAKEKAGSISDKIGLSIGVDADAGSAISDLIRSRVEIDPQTGKEIYKDAKGSALSVDREGFIEELKKEPRMKYLIKATVATSGGGNANGSNRGGAAVKQATRQEFQSWSPTKQKEFAKSGGTIV